MTRYSQSYPGRKRSRTCRFPGATTPIDAGEDLDIPPFLRREQTRG